MLYNIAVAPFAGAWIEISYSTITGFKKSVAPFAGAWIEILIKRGCVGLRAVAPFAGAWIEIMYGMMVTKNITGRSLRGSVD